MYFLKNGIIDVTGIYAGVGSDLPWRLLKVVFRP
jgi:hypothetical protein